MVQLDRLTNRWNSPGLPYRYVTVNGMLSAWATDRRTCNLAQMCCLRKPEEDKQG